MYHWLSEVCSQENPQDSETETTTKVIATHQTQWMNNGNPAYQTPWQTVPSRLSPPIQCEYSDPFIDCPFHKPK